MNQQDQEAIDKIKKSNAVQWIKNLFGRIDKRYIMDIIILTIALAIGYILFVGSGAKQDIKDVLKENKRLEQKIDSLKNDNQFITDRMFEFEKKQVFFYQQINENNTLIRHNNEQLEKLKKIYNEKITSINNYNVGQLDSFFTERYKAFYR